MKQSIIILLAVCFLATTATTATAQQDAPKMQRLAITAKTTTPKVVRVKASVAPIYWGARFHVAATRRALTPQYAASIIGISEAFWTDLINDRKAFSTIKENDAALAKIKQFPVVITD
jgi:hypothetical protein